jgi:hypothetical protein
MARSLVLFVSLIALSRAYTTFDTVCSTPPIAVNYVSSADTRGTLDILWSCLFTIIACTWTVQHLNVPEQREGRDPGRLGDIKWGMKRGWTSTKWMLATVIAPEILLAKYWGDLENAREDLEKFKEFAAEDNVPWTLSHCLFANMGGFVIRTYAAGRVAKQRNVDGQTVLDSTTQQDSPNKLLDAKEPSTLDATVPLDDESPDPQKSPRSIGFCNLYHLRASEILNIRKLGALPRLPYISPEELHDRSKSDSLVRTIAVAQVLWIVIQVLARAVRHFAISQLEISVVAFASCAVAIYGLNWYKPKGVQVPITILQYSDEPPRDIHELFLGTYGSGDAGISDLVDVMRRSLGLPDRMKGTPVPNTYLNSSGYGDMYGIVFGSLVFGGIHLAAWKFDFPTRTDQILWWSASVFCACLIITFLVAGFSTMALVDLPPLRNYWDDDKAFGWAFFLVFFFYAVARLILLVEIFRTLCFLPPDAYISTWASNVPHVA